MKEDEAKDSKPQEVVEKKRHLIDFRTPHPEPVKIPQRKKQLKLKPKPANEDDLRKLAEHFNSRRS